MAFRLEIKMLVAALGFAGSFKIDRDDAELLAERGSKQSFRPTARDDKAASGGLPEAVSLLTEDSTLTQGTPPTTAFGTAQFKLQLVPIPLGSSLNEREIP